MALLAWGVECRLRSLLRSDWHMRWRILVHDQLATSSPSRHAGDLLQGLFRLSSSVRLALSARSTVLAATCTSESTRDARPVTRRISRGSCHRAPANCWPLQVACGLVGLGLACSLALALFHCPACACASPSTKTPPREMEGLDDALSRSPPIQHPIGDGNPYRKVARFALANSHLRSRSIGSVPMERVSFSARVRFPRESKETGTQKLPCSRDWECSSALHHIKLVRPLADCISPQVDIAAYAV